MENKYKITFILLTIGVVITVIGALFKIMHWPYGRFMLTIGLLTEFIGILSLVINLSRKAK